MDRTMATVRAPGAGDAVRLVADFLGIHPAGRVMARLTGETPATLRGILGGAAPSPALADRLAVLGSFVGAARAALALADGPSRTGLARYRAWLRDGSIPTPIGDIRPLDALGDPRIARAAADDLTRTALALLDVGGGGERPHPRAERVRTGRGGGPPAAGVPAAARVASATHASTWTSVTADAARSEPAMAHSPAG